VVERVRGLVERSDDLGPASPADEPIVITARSSASAAEPAAASAAPAGPAANGGQSGEDDAAGGPARLRARRLLAGAGGTLGPSAPDRKKLSGPVAEALARGLALGRRRAAAAALHEALRQQPPETPLQPLWDIMAEKNLPESLTIGDLVAAVRGLPA
jgi:hypothetical protein